MERNDNKMKKWYLHDGTEATEEQAEKIRQKNGELFEAVYHGEKDFSELKNIVWLFGEEIEKQEGKSKNRNIKK